MSDATEQTRRLATNPSETEIAEWAQLSREEQLRRLRDHLSHPDCAVVTGRTMKDVLEHARRGIRFD